MTTFLIPFTSYDNAYLNALSAGSVAYDEYSSIEEMSRQFKTLNRIIFLFDIFKFLRLFMRTISKLRNLLEKYQNVQPDKQNLSLTEIFKNFPELKNRKVTQNLSNQNITNILVYSKGILPFVSVKHMELMSRLVKLQDFRFRYKQSYLTFLHSLSEDELMRILKTKQSIITKAVKAISTVNRQRKNYNEFRKMLKRHGRCRKNTFPKNLFRVIFITADGSCGFRALLLGYYLFTQKITNIQEINELQSQISYNGKNKALSLKSMYDFLHTKHSFAKRTSLNLNQNKWATFPELIAWATEKNIILNLYVNDPDDKEKYDRFYTSVAPKGNIHVHLFYNGTNHYSLLIPKKLIKNA